MIRRVLLVLSVVFALGCGFCGNVSVVLKTDKLEYVQGEMVNLSLEIENLWNESVDVRLSGKSTVGDVGFDIECYELSVGPEGRIDSELMQIPAMLSNSNQKQMTKFYACSGMNSRSQSVVSSIGQVVQKDEEIFVLNPFKLEYEFEGESFEVESNSVEIVVRKSDEQKQQEQEQSQEENQDSQKEEDSQSQQNKQQSQQQQQSQQSSQQNSNQQSGSQQNQQNSQQSQNQNQGLNQQQKQALNQNQQNSQSLSKLKNDISKLDVNSSKIERDNLSFQNNSNGNFSGFEENRFEDLSENEKWFWSVFCFLVFVVFCFLIYLRFFRKSPEFEYASCEVSEKVPYCLELLDLVLGEKSYKNSVKLLAQSVREFLVVKFELERVPTNNEALKISGLDLGFVDVLKRAERIEFARSCDELDLKKLVCEFRLEFEKFFKIGSFEVKKDE